MINLDRQFVKSLILLAPKTPADFANAKRKLAKKYKMRLPLNSNLIKAYILLLKNKKIRKNKSLEKLLRRRKIRTLSGVAPIAVLTKPYPCPGKCIYCPSEKKMPKSYLSNEPAVMRAIACDFDPYKQVKLRLKALAANGHPTDKIELIIMGGTWNFLPKTYQNWFIKRCFEAANGKTSSILEKAQKLNERAIHRIVGLTLETRPDFINLKEIKSMRRLGCTKVELGVQLLDDYILKLNKRGSSVKQVIAATQLLKQAGFKVCYHLMLNLYGSNIKKDFASFKKLFSSQNFQPDLIKIYPTVVTKNSKLYKFWRDKKYQPYTEKQLTDLIIKIKKIIPPYVRIIRIIRDIPAQSIIAGNKTTNLRQLIQQKLKGKTACQCIRCREAKEKTANLKSVKLIKRKYIASNGTEYFLSCESEDKKILYAFVRLRLQKRSILPELKDSAIIRELHTYGQLVPLKTKDKKAVQHLGLGKLLMAEAEKIAVGHSFKKIAVISGIGARQYYRKLGYLQEGTYMVKRLKKRKRRACSPL